MITLPNFFLSLCKYFYQKNKWDHTLYTVLSFAFGGGSSIVDGDSLLNKYIATLAPLNAYRVFHCITVPIPHCQAVSNASLLFFKSNVNIFVPIFHTYPIIFLSIHFLKNRSKNMSCNNLSLAVPFLPFPG